MAVSTSAGLSGPRSSPVEQAQRAQGLPAGDQRDDGRRSRRPAGPAPRARPGRAAPAPRAPSRSSRHDHRPAGARSRPARAGLLGHHARPSRARRSSTSALRAGSRCAEAISCSRPCSSVTTIQHQSRERRARRARPARSTCWSISSVPDSTRPASASSCSRWLASAHRGDGRGALARRPAAARRSARSARRAPPAPRRRRRRRRASVVQSGDERAQHPPLHAQRQRGHARGCRGPRGPRASPGTARAPPRGRPAAPARPCIAAYCVGCGVVELDLDARRPGSSTWPCDLVGEPAGHVQPQRPAVGVEDGQRAGLARRAPARRAARSRAGPPCRAALASSAATSAIAVARCMADSRASASARASVTSRTVPEDAHRLAVGVDEHPPAGHRPAHRAVGAQRAQLDGVLAARLDRGLHGLLRRRRGRRGARARRTAGPSGSNCTAPSSPKMRGAALVPVDDARSAGRPPRCRSSWPPARRPAGPATCPTADRAADELQLGDDGGGQLLEQLAPRRRTTAAGSGS